MADTIAPQMNMQNKQSDKQQDNIKNIKKNKDGSDITEDAKQAAKDASEWAKSTGNEIAEKTKETANDAQGYIQKISTNAYESAAEAGAWVMEKGNDMLEATKDTAATIVEKGKELFVEPTEAKSDDKKEEDSSKKSSKDDKTKEGENIKGKKNDEDKKSTEKDSKSTEKESKSDEKKEDYPGPLTFKDNTSVLEPPNENQRSMKESKDIQSVRTAANVGKGRETPQERLKTGAGKFKGDKKASKQCRQQVANTIVTNISEFSEDHPPIQETIEDEIINEKIERLEIVDEKKDKSKEKEGESKEKEKESKSKETDSGNKKEIESTEKSEKDKETDSGKSKKESDDKSTEKEGGKKEGMKESGEWKELLDDEGKEKTEKNPDENLQAFITELDEKQQEYCEERKKHMEMAQDPELSAFERIKAAGLALADGAMELTEAGRKKIAEFYAPAGEGETKEEDKNEEKK